MELYHLEAKPDDNELINLGFIWRKPVFGFPTKLGPNQPAQLRNLARILKFYIGLIIGPLYFPDSE